jgi:hypothetical protein
MRNRRHLGCYSPPFWSTELFDRRILCKKNTVNFVEWLREKQLETRSILMQVTINMAYLEII